MDVGDKVTLEPCPFCGVNVQIQSNRDWHKLVGAHAEDCVFDDDYSFMVPADAGGYDWLVSAWNRRTPSASIGEDGLPELPDADHALDCGMQPFYRPDQMRQYASEAVAADRRVRSGAGSGVNTWQERMPESVRQIGSAASQVAYMEAEIRDLRAHLAATGEDVNALLLEECRRDRDAARARAAELQAAYDAAPPLSSEPQPKKG